jgi:alpha,alpha-trehalase
MTAWVARCALDVLEVLPSDARDSLVERLDVKPHEHERWDALSRRMYVPFLSNGLIAQFDGYEDLLEFDWEGYREKYGNIQRLDRILEAEGDSANRYRLSKQADVLMLFYLLTSDDLAALMERLGYPFDVARIPETVGYYLDRTSHGSTLSAVVHAWVLSRSDRAAAWSLFERALRGDLEDSQEGTTREGIHLGAMGATVDIVQRAFTGCAFVGGCLRLEPCLPDPLAGLSMQIRYRSNRLCLDLGQESFTVTSERWSRETLHYYVRDDVFRIGPGERRRHRMRGRRR